MIVILLRTLLTVIERVARGIHLGVMVGFAVVAPKFKPEAQDMRTMRTFCESSSSITQSKIASQTDTFSHHPYGIPSRPSH